MRGHQVNHKYNARLYFIAIILFLGVPVMCSAPELVIQSPVGEETAPTPRVQAGAVETQQAVQPLEEATPGEGNVLIPPTGGELTIGNGLLPAHFEQLSPGVVNIQVIAGAQQGSLGMGAGSGFVIDNQGHIITNNHVVAGAEWITVVFSSGLEVEADLVGRDPDSDLAVIKVEALPEGVHPLRLGDSSLVQTGEWVIAIGSPFGFGGSMTLGIVSAVGRMIPAPTEPFTYSIPQAIQTDAAINPGNSGGPLINLNGEVIGVNAVIATGGQSAVGSGVGFAIPVNIVRRVAPVLIEVGSFHWPWLGVEGTSVDIAIQRTNNLETQQGAYIHNVTEGSPAARAGLRGSTGSSRINGFQVFTGGDVVIEVEGNPIIDYSALLVEVTSRNPGEEMAMTILRNGERMEIVATLEARP